MEYDLTVYIKAVVQGVPLMFVVMGLVWMWGKLGAKGKVQLFSSMVTGLILGVGYMVAVTKPPIGDWWQGYVYWFGNVVFGVGLGLIASGFYEIGKGLIQKFVLDRLDLPS